MGYTDYTCIGSEWVLVGEYGVTDNGGNQCLIMILKLGLQLLLFLNVTSKKCSHVIGFSKNIHVKTIFSNYAMPHEQVGININIQ